MAVKRYIGDEWITISGLQGPVGETGLQGPTGATGATGATGPANVLSIGTVTNGSVAAATITGTSPEQVLNLVLPLNTDAILLNSFQTITNKTIALGSNSISGTLAQFNTALTGADFASLAGAETLTNKTLTSPIISSISNTGTLTLPTATDTLVGRATTDTLTNKSVSLTNNTLTGTIAQFNTALSDADFATIAGTETLTNKTLASPTITIGGTTVSATELSYIDGVTSAIQTQINTKASTGKAIAMAIVFGG